MKHLNYIYIIILLVLVAACSKDDEGILDDGSHSQGEGQTSSSVLPGKELRGVWIATVWGLDWPMEKYNADVQKKLYTDYLDLLVGYNMNAVFSKSEVWQMRFMNRNMSLGVSILQEVQE